MKPVFQLAFVCFLALFIMSCGGGGSSSGVDQATDELDATAAAYARPGEEGTEVSSSSSSSSSSSTSSSTTTTTTSSSSYEGYVNKYGDLLAVYNASGGGQTKSAWGKTHYCNNGRNEGRTYSDLSSGSCSSTTTTTTTSSSAYEGYVNKYGDLLAVYNASGGGQTKSAWGKTHYCNNGRNEGRTYSGLSAGSCSSTTTSSTTTITTTSSSSYEGYVNKYGDLLAVYNASGGGQTKSAWGKTHYCNNGRNEGRTYSGLSSSSCSSTTTTTTTTTSATTALRLTSPNGGQSWTAGSAYNITWDKGDAGSKVNIVLYRSGSRIETIASETTNDGSYVWTISSSTATSSQYKIRIDSYAGSSSDSSDSNFSITKPQLQVNSPNGGQSYDSGDVVNIQWNTADAGSYVTIYLYKSGSYVSTISSATQNDGSYSWTIPASTVTSSQYKIRIDSYYGSSSDYSDGNFSVTRDELKVTSPNGGQSYETGDVVNIRWNTANAGSLVTIKLYKSGGYSSTISSWTSNDGSYSWTIPSSMSESSQYKIKIESYYGSDSDYSDSNFTITRPPLKLLSPNGGETWKMGTYHTIRWQGGDTSSYWNYVTIELWKGNNALTNITSSTSNDGSYSWYISSFSYDEGTKYRIKIVDNNDYSSSDMSNNYFTLECSYYYYGTCY